MQAKVIQKVEEKKKSVKELVRKGREIEAIVYDLPSVITD
jgi:hypothetical protein